MLWSGKFVNKRAALPLDCTVGEPYYPTVRYDIMRSLKGATTAQQAYDSATKNDTLKAVSHSSLVRLIIQGAVATVQGVTDLPRCLSLRHHFGTHLCA